MRVTVKRGRSLCEEKTSIFEISHRKFTPVRVQLLALLCASAEEGECEGESRGRCRKHLIHEQQTAGSKFSFLDFHSVLFKLSQDGAGVS